MSLISEWFWKTYRRNEGWFKDRLSIEITVKNALIAGLIAFGAGVILGAVAF